MTISWDFARVVRGNAFVVEDDSALNEGVALWARTNRACAAVFAIYLVLKVGLSSVDQLIGSPFRQIRAVRNSAIHLATSDR